VWLWAALEVRTGNCGLDGRPDKSPPDLSPPFTPPHSQSPRATTPGARPSHEDTMFATVRSVSRTRVAAGASGSRALDGAAPPSLHLVGRLGAVCQGGDAGAGSGPFIRGLASLGVGGGGCGVGGGGVGGTRGLSSSSGAMSASSLSDKLAAAHAAATRAARDNELLTPGEKAARGLGPAVRPGGPPLGALLKTRIGREIDPEGLLRLLADGLPNSDAFTVSHAFCKLGKL